MSSKVILMTMIGLFFTGQDLLASSDKECTPWTKEESVTCLFAGQDAFLFKRTCENICYRLPRNRGGRWGADCNQESVCSLDHPDSFGSVCSAWVLERGTICKNLNSNEWEDKWVRVCTVGLDESTCSNQNPN